MSLTPKVVHGFSFSKLHVTYAANLTFIGVIIRTVQHKQYKALNVIPTATLFPRVALPNFPLRHYFLIPNSCPRIRIAAASCLMRSAPFWIFKPIFKRPTGCSEKTVPHYVYTLCKIPKERRSHFRHGGSLKPSNVFNV